MKPWKENLVNEIIKSAVDNRIVSLREIANSNGYNHILSSDCRDILNAVLKALPDFRPVQFYKNSPNESLFTTLHFVENCVEFDNGDSYDN